MNDNVQLQVAAAAHRPYYRNSDSDMDTDTAVALMALLGHRLRMEIWLNLAAVQICWFDCWSNCDADGHGAVIVVIPSSANDEGRFAGTPA